jgi:hypothetical protein
MDDGWASHGIRHDRDRRPARAEPDSARSASVGPGRRASVPGGGEAATPLQTDAQRSGPMDAVLQSEAPARVQRVQLFTGAVRVTPAKPPIFLHEGDIHPGERAVERPVVGVEDIRHDEAVVVHP